MATWQENIETAMNNTAALLAEITENPRPSYDLHGHKVSLTEYQRFLMESMDNYARLLARGSPFEEISQIL